MLRDKPKRSRVQDEERGLMMVESAATAPFVNKFPPRQPLAAQGRKENGEQNPESEHEQRRGAADGLHETERRQRQRKPGPQAAAEIDRFVDRIDGQDREGIRAQQGEELPRNAAPQRDGAP